ncbi:Imm1 family immunity protein [Saccharothrix lopnurensis]|uniref:Imm1 family immunity protein n=1 Tax=Saccharothrix lopnurensis TaxID=1670621 RepID=A0ABW1NYJ6_9PSEU
MVDLEAWYDVNRDDPAIIRTPAELDAVLDAVTEWDGRIIVDLFVAGDLKRPNLNVGVNGRSGHGALYYAESQDAWFSAGQSGPGENPVERLLYYYMNASTEFPGDCEIPLDVVRRAAHEYMTTGGQRPTAPTWKPAPEWW